MKKSIFSILLLFIFINAYSQPYKLADIQYEIQGCGIPFLSTTKPYAVTQNTDLKPGKSYESIEDFEKELELYKTQLNNLRAFESIDIAYFLSETKNNENYTEIFVTAKIKDSLHFLCLPYGKYNSNTGTEFKLKLKDTNFLGTLNPLSSDINFSLLQKSEDKPINFSLGAYISYDFPFKLGLFNSTWVNEDSISYTFGDSVPQWNAKTGLKLILPSDYVNYQLELYQYSINNLDYKPFGDNLYFTEEAKFSTPIEIYKIENWGKITYTPSLAVNYNWDIDGIGNLQKNYSLEGPQLTVQHSLSTSKINWENNYRKGASFNMVNNFTYNFHRNHWYPYLGFEAKGFYYFNIHDSSFFNRVGAATDILIFSYLNNFNNPDIYLQGLDTGYRLRGIRDNQYYKTTVWYAGKQTAAIVANIDLPVNVLTTNFTNKYLSYFNFDLQISPFIDFSLGYNKFTKAWFNPKDGFYSAGFEVLVYPKKWSSYIVRASLGIDVGRKFFFEYLNMDWREEVSPYEISIGLGLLY